MTTTNQIALRTRTSLYTIELPEGAELRASEDYSLLLGGYEATLTVTGGYQARTGTVIHAALVDGIRGRVVIPRAVYTKATGSTGARYLQERR